MAGLDPAIQARHLLDGPRQFNEARFLNGRVKPGHGEAASLTGHDGGAVLAPAPASR